MSRAVGKRHFERAKERGVSNLASSSDKKFEKIFPQPHFSYKERRFVDTFFHASGLHQSDLHQSDDRIELFALGRLPDFDVKQTEEHLLVCHSCRDRLEEIGTFAIAMREQPGTPPSPARTKSLQWPAWLQPRFAMPGAFAVALLSLGIYWIKGGASLTPVATLQLTAMRGEMPTVGVAREIDLRIADAPPVGGPLRLEIVDAGGARVWTGAGLEVKIVNRLSPGDYFVRLFGSAGQLLHEYGFRVRG